MDIEEFDYVIVGGGSAGCVAGNLLSADKKTRVAVVEAGSYANNDPFLVAPRDNIPTNNKYFWWGQTIPDPDANNRKFDWTNGRVLGGGSSINGMIYTRGSPQRYDEWVPYGGPQWSADNVYENFKEFENFVGPTSDPATHGYNGPQPIRASRGDSPVVTEIFNAIKSTNAPGTQLISGDYNSASSYMGVFDIWQYWQYPDQTRGSSARAFMGVQVINEKGEGQHGRKLKVFLQSTATHIIYPSQHDCSNKNKLRAEGLIIIRNGKPIFLKIKEELHIAAGFKTPAFLQVNGIGPEKVLKDAGVQVRVNLAGVGAAMKNHYYIPTLLIPIPGSGKTLIRNSQPGDFSYSGAFLPDPRGIEPTKRQVQLSGVISNIPEVGGDALLMVVEAPLRPKSSGVIKIQNNDPLKIELADIGFLHNSEDLEISAATFTTIIKPAFQYLLSQGYFPISPSIATIDDPVALRDFIRNSVGNGHHYMAGAPMGPEENGGVTDGWGKIHDTENIRIIDDQVAPLNNDGNTNSTAEIIPWIICKHIIAERKHHSCEGIKIEIKTNSC